MICHATHRRVDNEVSRGLLTPGSVLARRRSRVRGRLLAALACSALIVPVPVAFAAPDELSRHRALWQAAAIENYRYAYNKYCACHPDTPPETVVTVRDGKIARVYHLHEDSPREVPARAGSLELYWTIDGLFDLIESATAAHASVTVRYDETLGYPRQLYIDYDKNLVGDEVDLRLTRFEPMSP